MNPIQTPCCLRCGHPTMVNVRYCADCSRFWASAYVRFRERLLATTQIDAFDYSSWVTQHIQALRAGYKRSGELSAPVYCRMQYARFRHGQLL
jgi:hypothetical protein